MSGDTATIEALAAAIPKTPKTRDACDREARRRLINNVGVIDVAEVEQMTGLSRVTIWRIERRGEFPKRLRLTRGRVAWKFIEIVDWLESLPRGSA